MSTKKKPSAPKPVRGWAMYSPNHNQILPWTVSPSKSVAIALLDDFTMTGSYNRDALQPIRVLVTPCKP